ncbi:MAG: methyl-accepting chemotaxis protein [Methyloligellaceae bacterium]
MKLFRFGVAAKVILLAVTPIIFMAILNLYSGFATTSLFERTSSEREKLNLTAKQLNNASTKIKDNINKLTSAISKTAISHQNSLLNQDADATAATIASRNSAKVLLIRFSASTNELRKLLLANNYIADSKVNTANPNEISRRVKFLLRSSKNLERAFQQFETSNNNTISLIRAGKFDQASGNFIYEETARIESISGQLTKMTRILNDSIQKIYNEQEKRREGLAENAKKELTSGTLSNIIILSVSALILIAISIFFATRQLASPIKTVAAVMNSLSNDDTDIALPKDGNDEIGQMIRALKKLSGVVDHGIQMRSAVESVNSGVMMIDPENRISQANPSMIRILSDAERDLRQQIPSFNSSELIGMNIDTLANLSSNFSQPYKTTLHIGPRKFDIASSPVFNKHGKHLGTVVELQDVTLARHQEELQKEVLQEVQTVVKACAAGDFTTQVKTEGLDGFLLELAQGMNTINKVSLQGLSEINTSISAIANGDLSKSINGNYEGMFDEIKYAFNNTLKQLTHIIEDATNVSNEAGRGNFGTRVNTDGKQGFMLELANGINAINEISDRGLNEIRSSVQAIARGDLSHNMTGNYDGMFHEIKDAYNNTLEQLVSIITDATDAADAASRGDFSRQIDITGKEGFMLELANGINSINNISYTGLSEMKTVIEQVSRGDLTEKMYSQYEGMFEEIKIALNDTIDKLSTTTEQIKTTADSVEHAVKEISEGSNDLSQRTEEQASSLQQTARSVSAMSETIQNNASNAAQADKLAENSHTAAEKGVNIVRNAVTAMERIEQSSGKISEITTVIDEIAFQINLLALNAAVEAARAGEAGKGFEVVAAEVRKLAQRSAEAAKDIAVLLEESGTEVRNGSTLVNETGASLEGIVGSVQNLASIVGEIAEASKEQASGIGQINSTVTQLDGMTQQNAALVEESNAASQTMANQIQQLNDLISFFKIGKMEVRNTPGLHVVS